MCSTPIDDFFNKTINLEAILLDKNEISIQVWSSDYLRRFLVFLAANYFENEITEVLSNFVTNKSSHESVVELLNKIMSGKYYQYFDWNTKNVNKFFSYFGEKFKKQAICDVENDPELESGIMAFLEIGNTRNSLVHERFDSVNIPKTSAEYYELYKKSIIFITYLKNKLK